ncbi:MAG: 4-(cytidine 5'-diphospho)-2-C-methyl-D-erythritol kinase [Ruminococcus sp.]|nr:4-(cytidine 5'-diphospho)-2-C-methyl-D-erythritol kinase [Ruminococcus sp.]
MKVKTAAKINLALDVVGRLNHGYHAIESVFQTVGIYDEVSVELSDSIDIEVSCDVPEEFASADPIPCDEHNIAYKAAHFYLNRSGAGRGCRIHIKKGIPSQAGMGGGSTDAAAVLYILQRLIGKEIPPSEVIGADVPFFLTGGTAYVAGIGEDIEPIADYSGRILVIAKGSEGVSTAEAYGRIDKLVKPVHPDTDALVEAINNKPDEAYKYFGNLFEAAIQLPEVGDIEEKMKACGALNAVMTGSGSAVFGLFESRDTAERCAEKLAADGYFAQVCETVSKTFIETE